MALVVGLKRSKRLFAADYGPEQVAAIIGGRQEHIDLNLGIVEPFRPLGGIFRLVRGERDVNGNPVLGAVHVALVEAHVDDAFLIFDLEERSEGLGEVDRFPVFGELDRPTAGAGGLSGNGNGCSREKCNEKFFHGSRPLRGLFLRGAYTRP